LTPGDFTVDNSQPTSQGLTRRELLKRGAALGGALAWATPAVQLIGMNPAMAQVPSDVCFCIKLSACNNSATWGELGNPNAPGNCSSELGSFPADPDCDPRFDPDPADFLVGNCLNVEDDQVCIAFDNGSATLFFPEYCELIYLAEKGGSGSCIDRTPGSPTGGTFNSDGSYTFLVTRGSGIECSHIEACFQC
jgi:hypothetical protein